MNTEISFKDRSTNFYELHKDSKPYKIVDVHSDVVDEFVKRYIDLNDFYNNEVSEIEKDTIRVSVLLGVVDMDREPVKKLSEKALRFLRELRIVNNDFVHVAYKTKLLYRFPQANSYKRILGVVKKHCLKRIAEDKGQYFINWFSKYSLAGYLGKTVKNDRLKKTEADPLELNHGYYSALFGRLLKLKHPRSGMLVMEMLTGRRVTECNIDNFTWLDPKDSSTRERIKSTYKILNDSIIDEYSWVDFSGQLKIKNVDRRKQMIEEGKLTTDLTYPIPLLFNVSEEEFNYWGDIVKMKVIEGNIERDLPEEFWDSEMGGVRRMRGYTDKLHKRLLPDLVKAHNFRAIYGGIISGQMVRHCNVSDKVKLMTILLGHTDSKSTENYRIIRVVNEELTADDQGRINNLEEIIIDLGTLKGTKKKRKPSVNFVDWSAGDRMYYNRYLKDKKHYDNLKVITKGSVDFTKYSTLSGSEFRKELDDIFKHLEEETGCSYRLLTTRYTNCLFSVIFELAKEVHRHYPDVTNVTKKRYLDKAYANYLSDL